MVIITIMGSSLNVPQADWVTGGLGEDEATGHNTFHGQSVGTEALLWMWKYVLKMLFHGNRK